MRSDDNNSVINKENKIKFQIYYRNSFNEMLRFSEILLQSYFIKETMQLDRIKKNTTKLLK